MQRRTVKILYDVHSWTGIIFGLVLFVVCFSGTVALFKFELEPWAQQGWESVEPGSPLKIEIKDVLVRIEKKLAERGERQGRTDYFVTLPDDYHYPLTVQAFDRKTGKLRYFDFHPSTGVRLEERSRNFTDLLRKMHTDLLLPKPYGRYIVGLVGVAFLLMIVTGIIIHRHIFRDLFLFRPGRSVRLLLADTHKVMGVWGLIFHGMIAYTGALLGLKGLLLLVAALAAFEGDTKAAREAVIGPNIKPAHIEADMAPITPMIAKATARVPDLNTHSISIRYWGDRNGQLEVIGRPDGFLATNASVLFQARDGQVIKVVDWRVEGAAKRIYNAVLPLHYGRYGGILVKFIYFVLGIATSLMAVSGSLIWFEKRAALRSTDRGRGRYDVLTRLSIGVCAGMPVATFSTMWANKLWLHNGPQEFFLSGCVYFAVWGFCLVSALAFKNRYQTTRCLVLVTGLLLVLIPVLSIFRGGPSVLEQLNRGHFNIGGVDLACVLLGMMTIWISSQLPLERPPERHRVVGSA